MTIKVEQEALIALETQPWPQSANGKDECLSRQCPKQPLRLITSSSPQGCLSPLVEKSRLISYSFADDEDSVYTSSTASFSEADSDFDRRVTFAEDLVTEVWERPYTEKEDISTLYYSNDETLLFRQEYRMERKLLSTLASDFAIDTIDKEDLSAMLASTCSPSSSRHRNGISRVIVLHNDRLETFSSPEEIESISTSPCYLSGSTKLGSEVPCDFFDTPEFWSGSITWW